MDIRIQLARPSSWTSASPGLTVEKDLASERGVTQQWPFMVPLKKLSPSFSHSL